MKNKFKIIVFISSLFGILLIIFISQTTQQTGTGVVKSVRISKNKITINLKNYAEDLIIFNTNTINLKKNDYIKFQGKQDTYKNKKQIIIDKIFLENSNTG